MLETGDFALNQRVFSIYSSLGFIPLEFRDGFTRVTYQRYRWRVALWSVHWTVAFVLELFKLFRLIQSLVYPELLIPKHLMVHVVHCVLLVLALYTSWNLRRRWPELVLIFNYSFGDLSSGPRNTTRVENIARKFRTATKSELILVSILPVITGGSIVAMALFIYDPIRMESIYSAVPETYQNKLILYSWLLLEFFVMHFAICNGSMAGIMQLGLFRKCLLDLRTLVADDRRNADRLRKLQLIVHLFNLTHSVLTYVSKQFCIFSAIVCLFVGIHMFGHDDFFSFFGILSGLYTALAYAIIYDDAFKIPLEAERVKMALSQELRLSIGIEVKDEQLEILRMEELELVREEDVVDGEAIELNTPDMEQQQEMNKRMREHKELLKHVRSVPRLGIKAGEFQVFTRESTTDFLGFVTQQVSSLLIAFQ